METLEQRIRRYLLARLRHRAVLDLYETAAMAGLLERRFFGDDPSRKAWMVSEKARQFLAGAHTNDRRIVTQRMVSAGRRHRGDVPAGYPVGRGGVEDGRSIYDWSKPEPVTVKAKPRQGRKAGNADGGVGISFSYVGNLVREHLPALSPMHVAVALLVARAVGTSLPRLSMLTNPLRSPTPFVLIKAPVTRFESSVGMMLEDGLLLPFPCKLDDALREGPLSGRYRDGGSARPLRKLKTVAGSAALKYDDRTVRGRLRHAMTDDVAPIVVVDETLHALTPVMTETADLVVECAGFDGQMIADLLHICAGVPPQETIRLLDVQAFDLQSLSIDDLVLAVRPGRSAQEILSALAMLIERCSGEETKAKVATGEAGRHRRSGGDRGRGKASEKQTSEPHPGDAGVDIILPVTVPGVEAAGEPSERKQAAASRTPVLSVETLSGYGTAREWAADLKADLALWREGRLSWPDMSTKLLLSGPPGTGKTTFARAICNSLQVPLLTTSVANWLEPGYLGDVLKLMSATFEAAATRAPSILFIDEIDNIGTRQMAGHRNYDDYWSSLINLLLELLDGAARTQGVIIIAATNLPDKIDPALLRSGRLETHVRIPLPDIETLIGILAHHLGDDLPEVLSSAPSGRPRLRLRPSPARDGDPQRVRRNAENRKAGKGKRVSP